jgi:hypothetical protein
MRSLALLLLLVALAPALLLAQSLPDSPTPPPSGSADWNRVGSLVHDQEIVVSARGGRQLRCLFTGATDATLFCEPYLSRAGDGEFHFDRADVDQVRLNQGRRNMKIVIWSLAGAGFVWGVSDPRLSTGGEPRLLTGLAGGAAGAFTGLVVSLPAALLIPGKLVYHRPAHALSAAAPESTALQFNGH